MKKGKLPKNWIIVSSKNHPDRVYYFNKKTNESTWRKPTLEQTNDESSEHIRKRCKHQQVEEEHSRAKTPEYEVIEDRKSCRQQSLNNKNSFRIVKRIVEEKQSNQTNKYLTQEHMQKLKKNVCHEKQIQKGNDCSIITKKDSESRHKSLLVSYSQKNETSQMKALREKLLQRKLEKPAMSNRSSNKNEENNLVSSFLKKPSEQTKDDITSSLQSTSSVLSGHNKTTISLDESKTTFTPQMRALYEKIRSSDTLIDKKAKEDLKGKQELKITKQTLVKTTGKQGKNIPNKRGVPCNTYIDKKRKNLAQDRMQKLRNSLNKTQKYNGSDPTSTETSVGRFNKTLPVSSCSKNIESISIHKNTEIRLKRLHNRILKETIYGKNARLNSNELQVQQNNKFDVNNVTKNILVEQAKQEVLYEEMDWEPMKDEEITLEVEVVRAQLNNENCVNVSNYSLENIKVLTQPQELQEKGPLYIVIDTNVFLTNLEIIEQARDTFFKNYPRPFIVIPWTVICELDYLKSDKSRSEALRTKARKAISFINEHFASKHPRIIGQTREQAAINKKNFSLDCPDDEILQCCLQIKNLKKDPVLLSYDKHLCTKAMIHCITTIGRDDSLEKLVDLNTSDKIINHLSNNTEHSILSEELCYSDEFYEDAKLIMKDLFSTIIVKQMTEIYGPDWETYVIMKPPWTVVTALKCIIKHWIAAINESFQQHTEPTARELLEIFERLPVGGRKLADVEHALEKCCDIIQAVNVNKHYDLMVQSFNAIMEIRKKCLKCITDIDRKKLHDKIGIIENVQLQEQSAEKALQCFKQIYSYARDLCGLAANIAGKAFPLNYNPMNPPLSHTTVKRLQPDITKKVTDLAHNLNKLLVQAENNSIKYQTLNILQQDLNAFLAYIEVTTMDVGLLDIFYSIMLKEEILKIGLRQLQELGTYYRAIYLNTCI